MTSTYRDLHSLYAERMVHHGAGMALFTPVSSYDLVPPCCGFFDRNGDWNLITRISHDPLAQRKGFAPLVESPFKVTEVDIRWQPKTSQGVTEHAIDTSANTPDNVAGGADAHIKYASSNKFGAVLITKHPVTLRAYHQEPLFLRWLEDNRYRLDREFGTHLRKYGMWIVTKAFTAPGCSINAWVNSDKQALITIKAKASMLGDLGASLSMEDTVMDKDWSHYNAKSKGEGVVVFVDGIETKPSEWFWERFRQHLPGVGARGESASKSRSVSLEPRRMHNNFDADTTLLVDVGVPRHLSVPFAQPSRVFTPDLDEDVIPVDAGPLHLSRASSVRRPSSVVSSLSSRAQSKSPSLRRERRSISDNHDLTFG